MRISLYDVMRSTIALAVLLSVALYLASLIESRIRTSQTLSPTVQVLFTKSLKIVLVSLAVLVAIRSVGIDLTALAVLGGLLGVGRRLRLAEDRQQSDQRRHPAHRQVDQARRHHLGVRHLRLGHGARRPLRLRRDARRRRAPDPERDA